MAGFHAYHPFEVTAGATEIVLSAPESAHLVRSLRAKVGEPVQAFDGRGGRWDCHIAAADARALVLRVDHAGRLAPPTPALALAQVLPKGGLMDDIIRAAVEIGVAAIFPLFSERCEVRLDAERAAARAERWNTIAVEACKQSGNPFVPRIAPPEPLKKWLAHPVEKTLCLVGSLEEGNVRSTSFFERFAKTPCELSTFDTLLIAVGPEGDFTAAEYVLLRDNGFRGVRFGPYVLRVPTAATYALTALDQLRQHGRART
jgi:16S rRNA (uracil1498-N3)-methyltransferase